MIEQLLRPFTHLLRESWNYKVERIWNYSDQPNFVVSVNHPGLGIIYLGHPRCLEQSKENARKFSSRKDAVHQAQSAISYWLRTRGITA
jgi:hypothetical protein